VKIAKGSDLDRLQAEAEAAGRRCVVAAVVLDKEGRAFVHRRGPNRVYLPDGWDLLGGHVEAAESLLDALAREIFEESGWRLVGDPRLIYVADWETTDGGRANRRREYDFLADVDGDLAHPRLEWPNHVEFRWIAPEEIELVDENAGRDFGIVRAALERAFAEGDIGADDGGG